MIRITKDIEVGDFVIEPPTTIKNEEINLINIAISVLTQDPGFQYFVAEFFAKHSTVNYY